MISETQKWVNLSIVTATIAALCAWILGKKIRPTFRMILGMVMSVGFLTFSFFIIPYITVWLEENSALLESLEVRLLLAMLAICLGVSAYISKRKSPVRYGQSEVIVGMLFAGSVASGMRPGQSPFSRWVALAGAAYVVARGLNNWSEGLKKDNTKCPYRSIKENVLAWFFENDNKDPGN